jgi:hypothetical protein
MIDQVRGALREQDGEPAVVIDQRHQHGGRHRVGGQVLLQSPAEIGIHSEQAPVGQLVLRLRIGEAAQNAAP